MHPVVLAFPGVEPMASALAAAIGGVPGEVSLTRFPDGESCVRLLSPVEGSDVAIVCPLDRPDGKLLPLLWLSIAAREQGARRVGLVAPYLGYMRQDAIFQAGQIVTARHFGVLLSRYVDWIVSVDPHLHRIHSLADVCTVPATVVSAAPLVADWVRAHVSTPFLIGPDRESGPWVEDIARRCDAPWTIFQKERHDSTHVDVVAPDLSGMTKHMPVLLDDIISTGRTMIAAARVLRHAGLPSPQCVAVHAVFAGDAYAELCAEATGVATCNTILHPSNSIDLTQALAAAVLDKIARAPATAAPDQPAAPGAASRSTS